MTLIPDVIQEPRDVISNVMRRAGRGAITMQVLEAMRGELRLAFPDAASIEARIQPSSRRNGKDEPDQLVVTLRIALTPITVSQEIR